MVNTSAIWQHALTSYHLLAVKKSNMKYSMSYQKILKNFLGKNRRMGHKAEKRQDRKSNGIRQKNKRGHSKVESKDSPETPDRRETSDIPGTTKLALFKSIRVIIHFTSVHFLHPRQAHEFDKTQNNKNKHKTMA